LFSLFLPIYLDNSGLTQKCQKAQFIEPPRRQERQEFVDYA